jgi:uncharacterized membrane protein YgdD (TMEM256/DUF423 family)
MKTNWIGIGAVLGALAVGLGAVGAHALEEKLSATALEGWKTAALYHGLHAIALVAVGLFVERFERGGAAAACFLLGVLLFSGSLYAHALGGPRFLVYLTPVGGVLLIAGWLLLALAAFRIRAGRRSV